MSVSPCPLCAISGHGQILI
jgi:hypothetical protein